MPKAQDPPVVDYDKAYCADCGKGFHEDELRPYHDFWSRTEPGETIPAGDCPDCGAFCYYDVGRGSSISVESREDRDCIRIKDRYGVIVEWSKQQWIDNPDIVYDIVSTISWGFIDGPRMLRSQGGREDN